MKIIDDFAIGDIVDIDDVNFIKNKEYDKAFPPKDKSWSVTKKEIKKRITFKIVSL